MTPSEKGKIASRNALVEENMGLAIAIAKGYAKQYNKSLLPDLIQEGNLGLIRAAELYDKSHGIPLSAYACMWIRAYIQEYLHSKYRIVNLPSWLSKLIRRLDKLQVKMSLTEAMDSLKLSPLRRRLYLQSQLFNNPPMHINEKSDGRIEQETVISEIDIEKTINRLMLSLDDREKLIIQQLYGINSDQKIKKEVAEDLGMTRQNVRLIEKKALDKMRLRLKEVQVYY